MNNWIKNKGRLVTRYVSPATVALVLAAIISGILLFVPPIHGLADNGDFYRAILSNGIYRLPSSHSQFLNYVITKFGIFKYFNENNTVVMSSQSLFVRFALLLNKLFYSRSVFDLRFMGAVYYVFFLGAVYLLAKSLTYPFRKISSYVIAVLVVVIFADSSFTLYFNSFFGESEMLITTMYAFAAVMLLVKKCYKRQWPTLLLFFVSTILMITSKQQNAPLALSYTVIASGLFFLSRVKVQKIMVAIGITGILASGALTYLAINSDFNNINMFQSFTHGVLVETPDPSKQIKRQGLDEEFALMRSQNYYAKQFDAVKPTGKLVQKRLLSKVNIVWITKYYLKNQRQFMNLMDLAAKDMMVTQVKAVGDYTRGSGHRAGAQTKYFVLYSSYVGAFFPGKFAFICLLAVGFIVVYAVEAFLDFRYRKNRYQGILRFCLVLGCMTVVVFVPIISVIGDGDADLAKHLFMAPLSLDLVFILFISDILNHTLWHTKRGGEQDD